MNAYDSAMTKIRNGQKIFRDNTVISLIHEMQSLQDRLTERDAEIERLNNLLKKFAKPSIKTRVRIV
jgi:uncharacterized protein YlxW (UPF0749 family)